MYILSCFDGDPLVLMQVFGGKKCIAKIWIFFFLVISLLTPDGKVYLSSNYGTGKY